MDWQTIIKLIPWALGILYVVLCEVLDTKGRIDQINQNYPRVGKLIQNRPMRLVLLVVAIGFLAQDARQAVPIVPPPAKPLPPPQFVMPPTQLVPGRQLPKQDGDVKNVPPPEQHSPIPPQSQLDLLIEANKRLTTGDRERLANALFDFAAVLDQANKLWGRANQEGAQLNQGWGNGSISKDFEAHRAKLREIDLSAKDFAKSFPLVREKWKYYSGQTNYIFGDNPDNDGPNAVINAVEAYSNYLDRWVRIENKDQRTTLELFEPIQNQFNDYIRRFALWRQASDRRLEQMKSSIQ